MSINNQTKKKKFQTHQPYCLVATLYALTKTLARYLELPLTLSPILARTGTNLRNVAPVRFRRRRVTRARSRTNKSRSRGRESSPGSNTQPGPSDSESPNESERDRDVDGEDESRTSSPERSRQGRVGDRGRGGHRGDTVPPEVALVATCVVALKLCYGLDFDVESVSKDGDQPTFCISMALSNSTVQSYIYSRADGFRLL